MKEYKFSDIYELVAMIDGSVRYGESFWNYNEEIFIKASSNFSKFTLLHLYTITRAFNYHSKDIRKHDRFLDEEEVEKWISLLTHIVFK